ncbi:MAG: glycosyltransferase family 2 protein [Candidatus Omnitrophica bacterium]|nr:glycosyltransferase family 2 protein [Candidatus Omnitrophota bacterium]MBU1870164.1 glycosyltransferase family 2 protein [Candidatus Omnitrophota bacterium]
MVNKKKVIVIIPAHDEEEVISALVKNIPFDLVDCKLVVDDASVDATRENAISCGAKVISHAQKMGCGPSIRTGIDYALKNGFEVAVVMAGNGKDDPFQISNVLNPVVNGGFYFVQGSRYLKGGAWKNMPLHRIIGTRAYSALFSILAGSVITDGTNGFRAFSLKLFEDKNINIWQSWINNYELESYLYYKVVKLGYKFKETPVSKIYPKNRPSGYTQMKHFSGWWSHFRPILLLSLGIKK